MFQIVPCTKSHIPWKFCENLFTRFSRRWHCRSDVVPALARPTFRFGTNSMTYAPVPLAGDATTPCTAYEKMNRYAARSPWFGGTSPALLFRMCCVSTAYRWRMGNAHAAHMTYGWRCHCVCCRVWELDHGVFTVQVACAQRTSHVRSAVNAILWRMMGMGCVHAEPINAPHFICNMWLWHFKMSM